MISFFSYNKSIYLDEEIENLYHCPVLLNYIFPVYRVWTYEVLFALRFHFD